MIVQDSDVYAKSWGALSTDSGSNPYLYAINSNITMDTTSYEFRRGEQFTNLYEKITFKVEGDAEAPIGATVIPVEAVARCYGDYQNQLSVVCKALRVVPQAPAKGQN